MVINPESEIFYKKDIEAVNRVLGKLNLNVEEINRLMDIFNRIGMKLFGELIENQVAPLKAQQEEILKLLRRTEYILSTQKSTPNNEAIETEFSKFEKLESEAKNIDKAYFAECIRQIDNGISLLKQEQLTGRPAASLMYSLEFSLQMAIIYVEIMGYEPKFELKFRSQLENLKNI